MVSRIPILHMCSAAAVLEQTLASFQHLHVFCCENILILRSPSGTRSCYLVVNRINLFLSGPTVQLSLWDSNCQMDSQIHVDGS